MVRDHSEGRATLGHVRESNERRFEALDRRGIEVVVDGPAVLQFLFHRTLVSRSPREFRLIWMLNVAGLLKNAENYTLDSV